MKHVVLVAAIAMCVACGGKKKKDKPAKDDPSAHGIVDLSKRGGASPMSGLLRGMMASAAGKPGPYEEPRSSKDYAAHKPYYAVLELAGSIVELKTFSLLGGSSGTQLRDITNRLDKLADNEKVIGLVVRAGELSTDLAVAEELRGALARFKTAYKRKRTLVCHTEGLTNASYYVFSVCDRIALAPTGQITISGTAAMPLHLKGLLDKLGVRADFLHVGAFKGAAEPLTRDKPSDAMLKTLGAILDQSFATLVAGVASGRRLPADTVKKLIDTAVFQDKDAVTAKLVDSIQVFESFRDKSVAGIPWARVKLVKDGPKGIAALWEMLRPSPKARVSGPHVGVIYAVGGVEDGHGGGGVRGNSVIASRPISAAVRAMARDDDVKAIVIRISSGGGSALASEIIWNAVAEAKKKKPVVVSMGGVAASGGYYIAAAATKIFASANTLTGSIGVVGGKLAIGGAAAKLGVKAFPLKRGKRALLFSAFDAWTDDERKTVQAMMEGVYKIFVTRVAAGRGKAYDDIHKIAQGRVWTGAAALKNGLVDQLGGLDAAIAEARKLGKVPARADLEIYPSEPTLMDYISGLGVSSGIGVGVDAHAHLLRIAKQLGGDAAIEVERVLRQLIVLRKSRVLTTMFLPVVFR